MTTQVLHIQAYTRGYLSTELDTLEGESADHVISILGHTSDGDGGGGLAWWDAGSSTTANGGTVWGSTAAGRWKRIYTGFADVKWFGATGNGSTNDTASLRACILACDQVLFSEGTYIITQPASEPILSLTSRDGVIWTGRGATIKVQDGSVITGFCQMLKAVDCTNLTIRDLVFDGNRQNRDTSGGPSVGSGSMAVHITGGSYLRFEDVRIINSTWDSWYVRATSEAVEATYPTDLYLIDCSSYYCRRNGISLIGAKRVWIRGGRWYGTTGDPGAGIELEPNASDTYGVEDVWISDVEVSENEGEGILVASANASVQPRRLSISNVRGRANAAGLLLLGACDDVCVDGVFCSDDTTAITNTGMVQVNTGCNRIVLRNLTFREVTCGSTSKALVYLNDTNTINTVDGLEAYTCSCRVLTAVSSTKISNVCLHSCTSDQAITLANGVHQLSNVYAYACTGNVILAGGTLQSITNVTIDEPPTAAQTIRITGGRTTLRGVTVYESGNAAGSVYPVYFDNAATIDQLTDVYCKAAGTDYTRANTIRLPTSLTGAQMRNLKPDPMSNTATWDPASIAVGGSATTTVTVTGADIGDPVQTGHSISIAGLTSTGYVSSANTVTVVLANSTAGAVDLASHTLTVVVQK